MEDDQLDILRIEALKSALKKKSRKVSQNDNISQDKEDNEEEESLRELALKSCHKDSSNKTTTENAQQIETSTTTTNQNDGVSNVDNSVEELHLRERALKSLLKKRVVKTETIIKKAIQNEIVSSSKTLPTEDHQTTTGEDKEETPTKNIVKKRLRMSTSLIPSTELRNFISDPLRLLNKRNDDVSDHEEAIGETVFAGSEDELSLCASDVENDDISVPDKPIIQCNVISSCCDQNQNTKESKTADQNIPQETESKVLESKVLPSDTNHTTDIIISTQETSSNEPSIVKNLDLDCSSGENLKPTSEIPPIVDVIDDEQPGPSGYNKPHESDSDSNGSVVEIGPPTMKHPRVLNLITDSDEDVIINNTQGSGKQKLTKTKKLTVRDKLAKQEGVMDEREDLQDLNCSICLGPFEDRTFLKQCFRLHSFCYICIIQWSELSRLCPLCKKFYKSLIHHVTKDLEYEEFVFPTEDEQAKKTKTAQRNNQYSENMPDGRRFRYASTVVDHEVWQARREERQRIEMENTLPREQRKISRRLRWSATKDRRKAIYRMRMFVKEVKQRGKPLTRDITPVFFQSNPAIKHRLVPWLLRDLNVLLGKDDEMIRFVMTLILNLIPKTPMEGSEFRDQLRGFLFEQTDHFVDELVSFAKSPYDIRGYDSHVVYDVPPQVIEIDNNEDTNKEPMERKILNEIFIADAAEDAQPLLIRNSDIDLTSEKEDNEEKEEDEISSKPDNESINVEENSADRQDKTSTENIVEGSENEEEKDVERKKSSKKKKRKHKKERKSLNENENNSSEDDTKVKRKKKRMDVDNSSEEHDKLINGESDDDGKENKKPKRKKKRKHKYKDMVDDQEYTDDLSESPLDRSSGIENEKKRNKKRKSKHRDKNAEDEDAQNKPLSESEEIRNRKRKHKNKQKKHHKHRVESETTSKILIATDEKSENDIVLINSNSDSEQNETLTKTLENGGINVNKENQDNDNASSSEVPSALDKQRVKKKKKKKRRKRNHNGGGDVTGLLSKFLDSNHGGYSEYNGGISQQIEPYLEKGEKNAGARKNKAIIKELLSIEKALLRSQRKKEINKLLDKQKSLEETRSIKRRAGDPDYHADDNTIYMIDDQLDSLYKKIEKGK